GEDIERDAVANENDDQDQDHRRNIDAAEIGHEVADRPQRRLGDAKEKVADHADDRVADVHHVERDQPGEDRGGDEDPDIELEGEINDEEEGAHGPESLVGGSWAPSCSGAKRRKQAPQAMKSPPSSR